MKIRGTTITTPIARHAVTDDSTVSLKPWSSKNTVDKLCPSFHEIGDIVVCSPLEGSPIEVVSHIKPKQDGSGDPSLTNIRPITGYGGIKLSQTSKNLLKSSAKTSTSNGVTFTVNEDKSITINTESGGATGTATLVHLGAFPGATAGELATELGVIPGELYTVSMGVVPQGVSMVFYIYNAEGSVVLAKEYSASTLAGQWDFTAPDDSNRLYGYIKVNQGTVLTTPVTVYPMLVKGTEVPKYEPYYFKSVSIDLGQTVYGGAFNWRTGELTIDRETIVFDGIYNKFDDIGTANGLTYCVKVINPANSQLPMCSHLKPQMSIAYGNIYIAAANWDQCLSFIQPFANKQEANAWLEQQYANGTPFTVCCDLKEPITINLLPREIYPLPGTNCISSNTGNTDISGKSDPLAAIQDLYNKLETLTATMTALTGV